MSTTRPLEPGCVYIGQLDLQLKRRTAAKYLTLRQRVYERTKKWIRITYAYGAKRSRADQQYLVDGWNKRLPGFYYAAPVGQSNHEPGEAFDINNWAEVGEAIIKEEAKKLGLVRDKSERWHWNDDGTEPNTIDWSLIPGENDMDARQNEMLTRLNDSWTRGEEGKHEDGEHLRTVWDIQFHTKEGRKELGWLRKQVDEIVAAGGFLNARMEHIFKDGNGQPQFTTPFDVLRHEPKEHQNTRDEIAALGELIEKQGAPAMTTEQILLLAKNIQPVDEEAIIEEVTRRVTAAVTEAIQGMFLAAATPKKEEGKK
jgi:hypothetical protein